MAHHLPTDAEIAAHFEEGAPLEGEGRPEVEAAVRAWLNANPERVAAIRAKKIAEVEAANRRAFEKYRRNRDSFNAMVKERQILLERARPVIELVGKPFLIPGRGGAVQVRASAGSGPGPIDSYYLVHRAASKAMEIHGGWSQWGADISVYRLPFADTISRLDPAQDHEISVIGRNKYGRVEAIPKRVTFQPVEQGVDTPLDTPDATLCKGMFRSGELGGGRYGYSLRTFPRWVVTSAAGHLDGGAEAGIHALYEARPGNGRGAGWIVAGKDHGPLQLKIGKAVVPFAVADRHGGFVLYRAEPGTVPWPSREERAAGIEVEIGR